MQISGRRNPGLGKELPTCGGRWFRHGGRT